MNKAEILKLVEVLRHSDTNDEGVRNMTKNLVIAVIATIVIAGGGGFFAGMKYQQSQTPIFAQFQGRGSFNPGDGMPNRLGNSDSSFRPVAGKIIKKDDQSITVELADGSSKRVLFSDTTTVNKTEEGASADLAEGDQVSIFGSENSDGSVTAQNIQIGGGSTRTQSQN